MTMYDYEYKCKMAESALCRLTTKERENILDFIPIKERCDIMGL